MHDKTKSRIDFLVNLAYYAAVILLVYLSVKYVLGWVLPFIVAFCIVSVVNPMIRFVNSKLKFSHKAASITVMALTYGLVGYLLFFLIMRIIYVTRDAFTALPSYYDANIGPAIIRIGESFSSLVHKLPAQLTGQLISVQDVINAIQSLLVTVSQSGMSYVTDFTGHIPTFIIAFVFTIMLTFFVGSQYEEIVAFFKAQLPEKAKNVVAELKGVANDIVLRYIKAIFKLMLITFAELSVGLLVLRAPNAIFVAAGIAFFDALPLFGTGAIMIPWVLIVLIQGNYTFALGLGILYAIVTVVRNIIEPHIVGQKLGLNPIVSIVSIYFGYKLIGVFGMIIMPIVTQIALELHKRGVVKLFKLPEKPKGGKV